MQDNEMFFQWDRGNNSQLFPIDYTLQDLAKLLDPAVRPSNNCDTRPIKRMLENSSIQSVLQGALVSDLERAEKEALVPKEVSLLPIETIPLLACLYRLRQEKAYKELLDKGPSNSLETGKYFINDLCRCLYEETTQPHKVLEDITFARHILFQNEKFAEVLLEQLWENQLSLRFDKFKDLAKQTPFDKQVYILSDCLLSLDRCILNLELQDKSAPSPQTASHPQEYQIVVQQMLEQLLSGRKKDPSVANINAVYLVRNTSLDDKMTMKGAFECLKKSKQPQDLLQSVRNAYLAELAKSVENSNTDQVKQALALEQGYRNIQDYLDVTAFRISEENLSATIWKQCIYQCQQVLDRCVFTCSLTPPPAFPERNYQADLLASLIKTKLDSQLSTFQPVIQLMSFYSAACFAVKEQIKFYEKSTVAKFPVCEKNAEAVFSRLLAIPLSCNKVAENPLFSQLENFSTYFERVWKCCYGSCGETDFPLYKDTRKFADIDKVANKLFADGSAAERIFYKSGLMPKTIEDLRKILQQYNELISSPLSVAPPAHYINIIERLLMVALLLLLHKVAVDTKDVLIKDLRRLSGIELG